MNAVITVLFILYYQQFFLVSQVLKILISSKIWTTINVPEVISFIVEIIAFPLQIVKHKRVAANS